MKWSFKSADGATVERLAGVLRGNPVLRVNATSAATLARLLVVRGISDPEVAEHFLSPALSHLHSPYAMSGMKAAIERWERDNR